MSRLSLSLLGPIEVCLDGEPATGFRYDKVRALLFYLAVESECAHSREALIGLLWPDVPEEAARANLRQALASLRGAIGDRSADPPFLLISRESVQWNGAANARVDVADFVELLRACSRHVHRNPAHCKPCAQRIAQAVKLYRGRFMDQFFLADSAAFEEWAALKREDLQHQALEALSRLAGHHERRGEYEQAEVYARRQLELEPWREEAHRQLMRSLSLSDKRSAALAQYEQCRQVLAEELGVEPEPETTALYEQIRDPDQPAPVPSERLILPAEQPHNLPPQMTPFIGREEELARIAALLDDPACRLVTLVGSGGIGKTRLALQVAVEQVESFSHGAYFVSLASLSLPEMLPSAITTAIRAPLPHEGQVDAQLLAYLHGKEMLLVLDNFEHLMAGTGLLVQILASAPEVTLLVTSRERLKLQGEWIVEIEGLPFPRDGEGEPAEGLASIELFAQSARRVHSGFALSGGERAQAGRICRMLEGVPLAIELAAAWTRMLSCEEITREIEKGLDLLVGSPRDLPARHHSVRAVFDHSWKLLTEEEQSTFKKLALFRGGFQREAAEQVAGGTLPLLGALLDKSLLRRNGLGWYELHELARQYAYEQLTKSGEVDQARDRHLAYFVGLAETAEPELEGAQGTTWLARLERENDNLRAALQWSLDSGKIALGLRLATALFRFWYWHSHIAEGRRWLDMALAASAQSESGVSATLRAQALRSAGVLADEQGDIPQALIRFEQSLALWRMLGDKAGQASALNSIGCIAWERLDYARARALFEESLALRREMGQKEMLSIPISNLGMVAQAQGDYAGAQALFEESLALDRGLHNQAGVSIDLGNLAWVMLQRGDPDHAEALFAESLALRTEVGDRDGLAYCLEGFAAVLLAGEPSAADARRSVHLFGAAERLRETISTPLSAPERAQYEPSISRARALLGERAFDATWAEGRAMSTEAALAEARRKRKG